MLLMLVIYLASICCCFATASPSWYYMFPDGYCTIADLLRKRTMLLFQYIASTITIVITIGICIGIYAYGHHDVLFVNGCQILDCFRCRDLDCYRDCGDLRFIPRSM